jgi:hypothetical protein
MAKLTPIKQVRRSLDADVTKLICNCGEGMWHFRVTQVGGVVYAECAGCLSEYGPWYVRPAEVVEGEV